MILLLFDVDGTLTPARKVIETEMLDCLKILVNRPDIHIGFVGGSDIYKQKEQLGEDNFDLFTWRFSENGLLAYHKKNCIHTKSFVELLGEIHFKKLINICLQVLSQTDCPVKRGTFIEFRNGMINVTPVGRSCSQKERDEFNTYDQQHHVRESMISNIKEKWGNYQDNINEELPELNYSIGGQISFDVFPQGWDKTYCLQFIEKDYDEIHFFGDKTSKGGNDYEIYSDSRVVGHTVSCFEDTITLLDRLFILY